MLQLRRDPDLTLEALRAERRGEVGVQHLDRNRPVVLEILSEVDGGHAAAAELAPEHVAIRDRGLEAVHHIALPSPALQETESRVPATLHQSPGDSHAMPARCRSYL
jgi:hypothetical protein